MSASNLEQVDEIYKLMTDRELLEQVYMSQLRVEMMVQRTVEQVAPTIEAFSKGGVMGLMARMRS